VAQYQRRRTWSLIYPNPAKITAMQLSSDDAGVSFVTEEKPGRVTALAVDPANSKTLYAGVQHGDSNSILESKDWGKSWHSLGTVPDSRCVLPSIRIPPRRTGLCTRWAQRLFLREHGLWLKRALPKNVDAFSIGPGGGSLALSAAFSPQGGAVVLYAVSPSACSFPMTAGLRGGSPSLLGDDGAAWL